MKWLPCYLVNIVDLTDVRRSQESPARHGPVAASKCHMYSRLQHAHSWSLFGCLKCCQLFSPGAVWDVPTEGEITWCFAASESRFYLRFSRVSSPQFYDPNSSVGGTGFIRNVYILYHHDDVFVTEWKTLIFKCDKQHGSSFVICLLLFERNSSAFQLKYEGHMDNRRLNKANEHKRCDFITLRDKKEQCLLE